MTDHILVIGFGGPTSPQEVIPFLKMVTKGVSVLPERLEEVAHHYEIIGGFSPYQQHAFHLVEKLKESLVLNKIQLPVFIGMRNWHPFLSQTVKEIKEKELRNGLGIILAPHRSEASFERYLDALEEAKKENRAENIRHRILTSWYDHPLFIQAQAEQAQSVLERIPAEDRSAVSFFFTAHSIPVDMAQHSSYEKEFHTSSQLVAKELGLKEWKCVYQSRSGHPGQLWLKPDILSAVQSVAAPGTRAIFLIPIGFLSDHTEVLYDLDVEARRTAGQCGMNYFRSPTVMTHPKFVEMLTLMCISAIQ